MRSSTQHQDNMTSKSLLAIISMMALTSTTCFRPPASNTHIYHRSLNTNKINKASKTTTTNQLHMVFDFFKKAQTEATEQMSAIATGLAKSRNQLLYNLEDSFALDSKNGMNLMDQLEETLLQADLGMATTDDVLEEARYLRSESTEIFGRDEIKALLRGKLLEALGASAMGSSEYQRVQKRAGKDIAAATAVGGEEETDNVNSFALKFASEDDPKPISAKKQLTVHFIMGANGMGKTTTIGKLAHRLKEEAGQKVLLAACDTFRAGAVAQLERWAERADVDCFSPNETTNGPSAVLYGALDKAISEEYDVLLVDTSGRLSNNDALTAELVKMKKVIQKRMSTSFDEKIKPVPNLQVPHETLLVIDAAQGRMALDSAKQWNKELGLSGLILTKLDGSAKGGSVVAVSRELGLPVKLVGVGEGIDDLRDFEPKSFVDGLLGIGVAGGGSSKEGKALEARLSEMRKERTQRAKTAPKPSSPSGASPMDGPAGQMTLQGLENIGSMDMEEDVSEMQMITPGAGATQNNKAKNKSKKKKKRKNKK